ncbi:hypothetical protein Pla52nx_000287 [Stieleria varia]|uniref:hypothetical protein n=1 Tax=Stieleria varia TaxID=2528005 RepID=UPI0018D2512E
MFCAFVSAHPELAMFAGILPVAIIAFSCSRRRVSTFLLIAFFTTLALFWSFSFPGTHPTQEDGLCATVGAAVGAAVDHARTLLREWI